MYVYSKYLFCCRVFFGKCIENYSPFFIFSCTYWVCVHPVDASKIYSRWKLFHCYVIVNQHNDVFLLYFRKINNIEIKYVYKNVQIQRTLWNRSAHIHTIHSYNQLPWFLIVSLSMKTEALVCVQTPAVFRSCVCLVQNVLAALQSLHWVADFWWVDSSRSYPDQWMVLGNSNQMNLLNAADV